MSADLCGTNSGYQRHRRQGTPICDGCQQARNAYRREYRRRAGLMVADDGTPLRRPGHGMKQMNGAYVCKCGLPLAARWLRARAVHREHLLDLPLKQATLARRKYPSSARRVVRPRVEVSRLPDPTADLTGSCCPAEKRTKRDVWFCTANRGHDGAHLAGDGTWLKAIWRDVA